MRPIVRGAAAALVAPALTLSALVVTSAPAAAAADPVPAERAADWLETQLTDGIVHNDQYDFDDIALSADLGLALAKYGGREDTVAEIAAAVEPRAHDEWYTYPNEGTTVLLAGSLAKTAAFARAAGSDLSDFGGYDLVAMLEGTVSTSGPTTGRVQDENNPFGDTNLFGQAYAAQVLFEEGSAQAGPVLDFLLDQQCSEGWFRLDFSARDQADQSCDADPAAVADTDATALALATMMQLHDDALVPAIDKAEAWLLDTQYANGAWDGRPNSPEPNANSTALVGSVLAELGDTDEALKAAAWVRAHQLVNVGGCTTFKSADTGAVAWNNAVRSKLQRGIKPGLQDQARRATAGGLAILPLAQAADGDVHVLFGPNYVHAGGTIQIGFAGAAPGEAICARIPGGPDGTGWANARGEGGVKVGVPAKGATYTYRVGNAAGPIDTVEVTALGKKKLDVTVSKKRVAVGDKFTVVLRGLAPGELGGATVRWAPGSDSSSVSSVMGQANGKGVIRGTFTAMGGPGQVTVKGQGQFRNRAGSAQITVTR